jgi:hypothetical protein
MGQIPDVYHFQNIIYESKADVALDSQLGVCNMFGGLDVNCCRPFYIKCQAESGMRRSSRTGNRFIYMRLYTSHRRC